MKPSIVRVVLVGIVIAAIVVSAVLLSPGAREATIGILVTIWRELDRALGRPGTTDEKSSTPTNGGAGPAMPVLLIFMVSAITLSQVACGGSSGAARQDGWAEFGGAEVQSAVSPDGVFTAEAHAGMSVDMVDGDVGLQVELDDEHHYILFDAMVSAYGAFGAVVELDCDLAVPTCEVCLLPLNDKEALWCRQFGDVTPEEKRLKLPSMPGGTVEVPLQTG